MHEFMLNESEYSEYEAFQALQVEIRSSEKRGAVCQKKKKIAAYKKAYN